MILSLSGISASSSKQECVSFPVTCHTPLLFHLSPLEAGKMVHISFGVAGQKLPPVLGLIRRAAYIQHKSGVNVFKHSFFSALLGSGAEGRAT